MPLQGAAVARTDAALRTLQGQLELRRDAEEPRSSRVGKWAVLQWLQKKPSYNGKLVSVGLQHADPRFETARPGFREDGSREELVYILRICVGCPSSSTVLQRATQLSSTAAR